MPEGRLAVLGIGLGGVATMSPRGRRLLADARSVVGHALQLDLAGVDGRGVAWDGAFESLEAILGALPEEGTVVLASGDPNLFGLAASLIERRGAAAIDVEPAVSSLLQALARAAVPAAGAALLSAHGRSIAAAAGQALAARRA